MFHRRAIRPRDHAFAFSVSILWRQRRPTLRIRHGRVTKWCVALDGPPWNVKTPKPCSTDSLNLHPAPWPPNFPPASTKTPPAPLSSRPAPRSPRAAPTSRRASSRSSMRRAGAEDVLCYAAADLAALAERAFDFLQDAAPGAPKIRCETVACRSRASARRSRSIEIVNDDMPFLFDSVMGELAERRLAVQLVAHPVFGVWRDGAKLVALGAPDAAGQRARELHPCPPRADRRRGRARGHRARAERGARRSAAGGAGLARHARARQRHGRRSEDQSAAAAGGRDRRGDPVPAMAAGRQFHLPRRAQLHLRRQYAGARFRQRARHHALARATRAQARQRAARIHAGDHGVPARAAAA